jgi:hypothetical protein
MKINKDVNYIIAAMAEALDKAALQLDECWEFMDDDEELGETLATVNEALGEYQLWKQSQPVPAK